MSPVAVLRPLTLAGGFDADLFYRLAGAKIAVDPLRVLSEDIPNAPAVPVGKPDSLAARVAASEARGFRLALERSRGDAERAANVLGTARHMLNDKINCHGIRV